MSIKKRVWITKHENALSFGTRLCCSFAVQLDIFRYWSVIKPFLCSCWEVPPWETHLIWGSLLWALTILSVPAQKISEHFCFGTQRLVSAYCAPQTAVIKGSFTFPFAYKVSAFPLLSNLHFLVLRQDKVINSCCKSVFDCCLSCCLFTKWCYLALLESFLWGLPGNQHCHTNTWSQPSLIGDR